MVEGGAGQLPEDVVVEALLYALSGAQPVLDLQETIRAAIGRPKRVIPPRRTLPTPTRSRHAPRHLRRRAAHGHQVHAKQERIAAIQKVHTIFATHRGEFPDSPERDAKGRSKVVSEASSRSKRRSCASRCSRPERRIDGRSMRRRFGRSPARSGCCRVRTAVALTRGEEQAVVTATPAQAGQSAHRDAVGQVVKNFMLHTTFRRFRRGKRNDLRGPSRREIGHGAARRAGASALIPTRRSSRTRSDRGRRSRVEPARRRWRRCAAVACRSWMPACDQGAGGGIAMGSSRSVGQ